MEKNILKTRTMKEQLKKDYPWLFKKKVAWVNNKKREFKTILFDPIIVESDAAYFIYREKDSSPLILSKSYARD